MVFDVYSPKHGEIIAEGTPQEVAALKDLCKACPAYTIGRTYFTRSIKSLCHGFKPTRPNFAIAEVRFAPSTAHDPAKHINTFLQVASCRPHLP